jgi:hypothetical protein
MAQGILESQNFDRYMSLSEKQHRHAALAANDAFAAAMTNAVRSGCEHVAPGTFVDLTPSYARLIRGESASSACGSPAAMCFEQGGAAAGAEAMK